MRQVARNSLTDHMSGSEYCNSTSVRDPRPECPRDRQPVHCGHGRGPLPGTAGVAEQRLHLGELRPEFLVNRPSQTARPDWIFDDTAKAIAQNASRRRAATERVSTTFIRRRDTQPLPSSARPSCTRVPPSRRSRRVIVHTPSSSPFRKRKDPRAVRVCIGAPDRDKRPPRLRRSCDGLRPQPWRPPRRPPSPRSSHCVLAAGVLDRIAEVAIAPDALLRHASEHRARIRRRSRRPAPLAWPDAAGAGARHTARAFPSMRPASRGTGVSRRASSNPITDIAPRRDQDPLLCVGNLSQTPA